MLNKNELKIAYFGRYNPTYTRVRTTLKGLKKNNVEVYECFSNVKSRLMRLIDLTAKYLKIANKIDVLMVSEAGQSYVFLAKILALFTKQPLIFDAFLSYYLVKVEDEKNILPNSLKGRYFYWLDKLSCALADLVILDTQEHIDYFSKTFHLPKKKFRVVPVGSDNEIFYKKNIKNNFGKFLILSVSSFYPLHGIEYIIKAAKILENQSDIKFLIIGNGPTVKNIENLIAELKPKNIEFKKLFISPFEFSDLISKSDVCLGQFGQTNQTQIVVPAKIYDCLAMGKPIITGYAKSVSKILTDKKNVIFCSVADEESLAKSIILLKNNPALRKKIGGNGHKIFEERFSTQKIGAILKSIIKEQIQNGKSY